MHPSITTIHLAFTILFDFRCCVWIFLYMLQIHIPTVFCLLQAKPHHTQEKDIFFLSPTLCKGRGFQVSGKTLSRTHTCRITCEVQLRLEAASQVSLQTQPSPSPSQRPRPGGKGVKVVSDTLSPLLLELRSKGLGAKVGALLCKKKERRHSVPPFQQ